MLKPFCVGIIGGMGPLAGVRLQELIIQATPAECDQDHIPVLCYTNPQIPDRTASLERDGGDAFVPELCRSAQILESAGASVIVMACHTAHARWGDVQRAVRMPVLHLVEHTVGTAIAAGGRRLGLLATDGTLRQHLFDDVANQLGAEIVVPNARDQERVMRAIYGIKANENRARMIELLRSCMERSLQDLDEIILGCTELSLCADDLRARGFCVRDPLEVIAKHVVGLAMSDRASRIMLKYGERPSIDALHIFCQGSRTAGMGP